MTRYSVMVYTFQSPKSFYDIGTGAETLKLRPEWAHIKERDMDTIEKAKEAAFKAAYDSLSGADYDEVRTAVMIAIDAYDKARPKLHFVFDAFPSPEGSRLIEVEDDSGCSVSLEWASRNDGNVELCVNSHASLVEEVERLREAIALAVSGKNLLDGVPSVTISREAYDAMLAAIGVPNA